MNQHSFCNNIMYLQSWVKGRIRVLENHLHMLGKFFLLSVIHLMNILTFVQNLSIRRFVYPNTGSSAGCFSTTGFSHNAKCLSLIYLKRYIIYRFQCPFGIKAEIFLQMIDFHNHFLITHYSASSSKLILLYPDSG